MNNLRAFNVLFGYGMFLTNNGKEYRAWFENQGKFSRKCFRTAAEASKYGIAVQRRYKHLLMAKFGY